ncbi:MAG: mannonate dehydratase, partial [Clostridia bacterium]|nr:mannonate dehydratase [Clostridia bacterium]
MHGNRNLCTVYRNKVFDNLNALAAFNGSSVGFRWYGEGNDKITLNDIRQIPGVSTIVWALHDKMPG